MNTIRTPLFIQEDLLLDRASPGRRSARCVQPLKLYSLASATVRDLKDLLAHVPRGLIRFALTGGRLPNGLLFEAVNRNRAEQGVTRPRAALIKMIMLSHGAFGLKEEDMVQLDTTNKEPAYLCGRLFAILESIQRSALGGHRRPLLRQRLQRACLRLWQPNARLAGPPGQAAQDQARPPCHLPKAIGGDHCSPDGVPTQTHPPAAGLVCTRLLPPARLPQAEGRKAGKEE